jgi:predicted lipoprotein with Yx(FWY)xxD motif
MQNLLDGAPAPGGEGAHRPSLGRRRRGPQLAAMAGTVALALSAFGAAPSTALAATRHNRASKVHAQAKNQVAVDMVSVSKYGKILVDQKGFALYTDAANKPPKKWPCKGACLTVWPPLVLAKGQAKAVAGKGVIGLGVVNGPSGRQVTWHGKPLYTFVRDQNTFVRDQKGTVRGQGIVQDGTWFVARVQTAGTTKTKTSSTKTSTSSTKPKSTWA